MRSVRRVRRVLSDHFQSVIGFSKDKLRGQLTAATRLDEPGTAKMGTGSLALKSPSTVPNGSFLRFACPTARAKQ